MGDKTKISWSSATWNPIHGCDRVSDGCDRCYALTMANRLKAMGLPEYQNDGDPRTSGPGFKVTLRPDRLDQPLRWRKPRRIFVNSLSDLFHDEVPDEFIRDVFAVMASAPRHTFQILTKRPGRMRSLLASDRFRSRVQHKIGFTGNDPYITRYWTQWPLPNVWLGVSAEDQKWADVRIPLLLATPAAVRFVSAEPLLGPIKLAHMDVERQNLDMYQIDALTGRNTDMGRPCQDVAKLDWLIVGGESGPGARRMDPQWARDLRDQCSAAGVAFFMKQTGAVLAREWGLKGKGEDPQLWPEPFEQAYPVTS